MLMVSPKHNHIIQHIKIYVNIEVHSLATHYTHRSYNVPYEYGGENWPHYIWVYLKFIQLIVLTSQKVWSTLPMNHMMNPVLMIS